MTKGSQLKMVGAVAAMAAVAAAFVALLANPAGAAADQLPDLRMYKLENLYIQGTSDGRRLLRFETTIVNVGAGAFELRGSRLDTSTDMGVTQRIYDSAGGYRERATTAKMYFAGDGHTHWHVRDLEEYKLIRLYNGRKKVRTGAKHGFCFYDDEWFGSTQQQPYYTSCGSDPDALEQTMGLSRGWADVYHANLVDQYIDVTGLPAGRYKLRATADAGGWFKESKETNNFTWVDIRINGQQVSVLRRGPFAKPIG